jgi:Arc/MetJ-type ribon-helix-helix transcriptional regulator
MSNEKMRKKSAKRRRIRMKRLNIELSDKLFEEIRRKVENGDYRTVSEFVRAAIRALLTIDC